MVAVTKSKNLEIVEYLCKEMHATPTIICTVADEQYFGFDVMTIAQNMGEQGRPFLNFFQKYHVDEYNDRVLFGSGAARSLSEADSYVVSKQSRCASEHVLPNWTGGTE